MTTVDDTPLEPIDITLFIIAEHSVEFCMDSSFHLICEQTNRIISTSELYL